ncbi:MAG: TIM barrel protein [Phycisphaerae bacterium]|nr:TIM barrel protein [Phycisphaerae bacterium]
MPTKYSISRRTLLSGTAVGLASACATNGIRAESAPTPDRKGRIRQSVAKWCFDGRLPFEDLCRHAKRIGYQAIDLIGPQDWLTAKKYGLSCAVTPGPGSNADGFNRKEHHAVQVAQMKQIIDLAAQAGVPNVSCMSGERKGMSDEEGIRNCIEGLKQIAGHAEKQRVNICMEYLNSKVDHKDYQFDHLAFGLAVVRQVGSPRVGILYDIYHAQIMDGDIIRTIGEHHEYFLHYHTAGNPGRNDIDETQELYYPAIMRAIAETGYQGFVAQEFLPKGDPVRAMEQAFKICDV